jgi:3-dehydroquinate synthase
MEDEKDRSARQILNFGHTVGHAIEAYTDYEISHGRAVSLGISAETLLSFHMKVLPIGEKERIFKVLHDYDLPTKIPKSYDRERLVGLMQSDKKAEGGEITVVLPLRIGAASIIKRVPASLIESVLQEVQE